MKHSDKHAARLSTRRQFLARVSLGLMGLAGAVVSVPIVSYLLSPLLNPAPEPWLDVGAADAFKLGDTVKVDLPDPSSLPWAGQTSRTAAWVRRDRAEQFTVFAVNCTHLGCPVRWLPDGRIFLCPCHGGVFDAQGKPAGGPPQKPLFQSAARIQNGRLQVLHGPLPVA